MLQRKAGRPRKDRSKAFTWGLPLPDRVGARKTDPSVADAPSDETLQILGTRGGTSRGRPPRRSDARPPGRIRVIDARLGSACRAPGEPPGYAQGEALFPFE